MPPTVVCHTICKWLSGACAIACSVHSRVAMLVIVFFIFWLLKRVELNVGYGHKCPSSLGRFPSLLINILSICMFSEILSSIRL